MTFRKTVVIGVGNPYRRDDGVGIAVIERIRHERVADLEVAEESGEPAALVERWKGRSLAIIVDAVASGAPVGSVQRFECHHGQWRAPASFSSTSSHGLGVAEAIELGRVLDRLPDRLLIFGVEAADFADGAGLSAKVAAVVAPLAGAILREVQAGA